jgi:hypothetical protein
MESKNILVWLIIRDQNRLVLLRDPIDIVMQTDSDGITRSRIFPGLWLNDPVALRGAK